MALLLPSDRDCQCAGHAGCGCSDRSPAPCGCSGAAVGGLLDWIDQGAKLVEDGAEVAADWGVPGADTVRRAAGQVDDAIPDGKPKPKPQQADPASRIEQRRAQRRREFTEARHANNEACHAFLERAEAEDKAAGLWSVWTERLANGQNLRIELREACRQATRAPVANNCPPRPIELELMGVTESAWCRGNDADFAPLIAAVRKLELTAEERTRLLATPIEDRPAAFKALVQSREGGMPWWAWVGLIVVTLTAVGLVVWKLND